ncbi:hypothetical protein D3C84_1160390 [compost metagenome]
MSNAGAQQRIETGIAAAALEPFEEVGQLLFQSGAWRGFKVHGGAVEAAGNNLHGLFAA